MKEKKYKVKLLQPTINEEIIYAESKEKCYAKMMNNIIWCPNLYLNISIEEMEEDEENEQEENEQEENE